MKNIQKYITGKIQVAVIIALFAIMLAAGQAQAAGLSFASPDAAVEGLLKAIKSPDPVAGLVTLMGDKARDLAGVHDQQEQKENLELFVKAYDEAHVLRAIKLNGHDAYVLEVGKNNFPLPVPITQVTGGIEQKQTLWHFDAVAGYDELLTRLIGRNELNSIQVCLAFVDAQQEYYLLNPQGGRPGFASRVVSRAGQKDGLYWPVQPGDKPSPLGEYFANAATTMEARQKNKTTALPYHGYFYRMLPGQGKNSPGGAMSYAGKDGSVTGYALLAYPATYGRSGIMSFIVNQDGTVYEKNLGPKTQAEAVKIKVFEIDKSWRKVDADSTK